MNFFKKNILIYYNSNFYNKIRKIVYDLNWTYKWSFENSIVYILH